MGIMLDDLQVTHIPFLNGAFLAVGSRGLLGATFEASPMHPASADLNVRLLLGDPSDLQCQVLAERLSVAYFRSVNGRSRRLVLALSVPKDLLSDMDGLIAWFEGRLKSNA
jgi:hypothetical protein